MSPVTTNAMHLQVSTRGRAMPASPIRKLMPLADEAKGRGVRVYHLNIGQPDIETPKAMRQRLALAPKVLAYSPSGGTSDFLAALQAYYESLGLAVTARDLIATTGGSEALQFAMLACSDPGGDVLLPEPFYTNYTSFATMTGLRLVPLTTRGEDGFHLPAREAWERALTPKTRLVVLCNPNNPTGTVYTPEEVATVAGFCRDRGLFLVVDEVYRELVYDGRRPSSALALAGFEDNVVVVDSLSKRYSACGMRLGALVTRNREVHDACLRMAQGRLSAPGLAQMIAVGLQELGPEYTEGIVQEYEGRRNLLFEGLSRIPGLFLRKPEGAFYFVARLPVEDGEDFARFLLSDFQLNGATVMVAPAEGFYASAGLGRNEVRIAYVLNQEDLQVAVRVFEAGLLEYRRARGLAGQSTEIVSPARG